jgi:pyruvate formate lyase activating enzyme
MQQRKVLIFNIQKFSIHDGPGIRTAVFFKGCPLRCHWCSNPESQMGRVQVVWDSLKCIRCKKCVKGCAEGAISEVKNGIIIDGEKCKGWRECIKGCPVNAFQVEGEYRTVDEIVFEVLKDRDFYEESGGGVTLTGGEVLQQVDVGIEILKELNKHNVHRAVETTGHAVSKVFERFLEYVDLLLFDLKHYDPVKHREGTGVDNEIILENMKLAVKKGKKIIARIPVIPNFNDSFQDAEGFCTILIDSGIKEVNLLPFHQFGQKKYELLGMNYSMNDIKQLHPEDLQDYRDIFLRKGLDCKF